jgi:hypothetical protein
MFKCTQKYIERFYSKITIVTEGPEKGCWKIDYCCNKQGYAIFNNVGAHRFMYLIWHQDEEEKMIGLDVCHTCDNRWCVNPDHLWLGTNEENMKDMVSKNRQAKGSKHGRSVLNENIINEILSNILNGKLAKITKIAEKYQVHEDTIYRIINNKQWLHVTKSYDMIKIKKITIENRSSLAPQEIRDIRIRLKTRELQQDIAKSYNVSPQLISDIKHNRCHTNII